VESYTSEEVHLYVKHIVDDAIIVKAHFFLPALEGQDGERSGG
jgi:hypothetical protein